MIVKIVVPASGSLLAIFNDMLDQICFRSIFDEFRFNLNFQGGRLSAELKISYYPAFYYSSVCVDAFAVYNLNLPMELPMKAPMRIITWNVNGIRAVERKGEIQNFITAHDPDVFMMQEIKGTSDQFSPFLTAHEDYHQYYSSAQKKGYAGTSLWVKSSLHKRLVDAEFKTVVPNAPNADEGRICHFSFTLEKEHWDLFSIYFPNGGKSEQAWQEKLVFYDRIHEYMSALRRQGRIVLVGGDMNVAHTEIDIARPKDNDGKIGFHPKERAWMDNLVGDGWADVWREKNPGVTDVYSWWHMISRSRERNVGWRIDYFLMDQSEIKRVRQAEYLSDQMGSDHCPLSITLN